MQTVWQVGVVMAALLLHKLHNDTLSCRQCDRSWLHCYCTNFTMTHSHADSVISHGCTVTTQTSQWYTLMQTVWSVMAALLLHKLHNDTLSCRQCDQSWLHCYYTNFTMTHSDADSVIVHDCTVTAQTSQWHTLMQTVWSVMTALLLHQLHKDKRELKDSAFLLAVWTDKETNW